MSTINFTPTKSNVDLRGASFANRSALDSFNRAISGLRNSFEGIDNARDEQALNAFQNQIGNLSADELDAFDIGAQVGTSRLNRSVLDNVLNKRLASVRAQEEAGFKAQELARKRRENPLMQNILSELNGKSSQEQQAILDARMANLPTDVSGQFKNDLFAAAQGRLQNTLGNERAATRFSQQQADRQNDLATKQRMSAAENQSANILSQLGADDTEDSALAALRGSGEYANLNARERNQAESFLRDSYRKRTQVSPEAQKVLDAADATRQAEFKIQHQELNNARQQLGNRPQIEMKASDPKSRNETLGELTNVVKNLEGNGIFGGNSLNGEDLLKEAREIMTDGFTLEGDKYSPDEIDGRFLINAVRSLDIDGNISKETLHKAIADSITATQESQIMWDRKNLELDEKFYNLEHNILGTNKVESKRLKDKKEAIDKEDRRLQNINNAIVKRTQQRQNRIPTFLIGTSEERNNTVADFRETVRRLRNQ